MSRPGLHIAEPYSRFVSNKEDPAIAHFMSEANRRKIHNLVVKSVYERTGGQAAIGQQSDNELQVVMIHTLQRQYNHHLPITELNRIVVQKCTDNIVQNIAYYTRYLKDMNAPGPVGATQAALDLLTSSNTRESKEQSFKALF